MLRLEALVLGFAFLFISFFLAAPNAHAADRFWVGTGSVITAEQVYHTMWENIGNWSTVQRGAGGASVPGVNDVAHFTKSGAIVLIRSNIKVAGIVMDPTWSGSLMQGTGTMIIGGNGLRIGSGRLVGGNAPIAISGSYVQTGGIVKSIMSTLTLSGSLSQTLGSSSSNSYFSSTGTLIFNNNYQDQNLTVGAGVYRVYKNLTVNNTAGTTADDIIVSVSGGLTMSGVLTVTTGNFDLNTNSVNLNVRRGISIASNAQATFTSNGNVTASGSIATGALGTFTMGDTNLILNGNGASLDTNGSSLYNLWIRNSNGTVTLTSDQQVENNFLVLTGSIISLDTFTLAATGATITNGGTITESTGKIVHTATNIALTDSSFSATNEFTLPASLYLTVTDQDENIDGTSQDTISVTTTAGPDIETITLTETSAASGIFRGNIFANASNTISSGSNVVEVASSNGVTLSFLDAQDALTASDSATLTVTSSSTTTTTSGGGGGGGGSRGGGGGGGGGTVTGGTTGGASDEGTGDQGTGEGSDLPSVRGHLEVNIDGKAVVLSDVPANSWFASFVSDIVNAGIASGYRDARGRLTGEFGAANPVTFAEIAKMALGVTGRDADNVDGAPQNRTAKGEWSAKYIKMAEDLNLSEFHNSLNVNASAPRGAVIQTIVELLDLPTSDSVEGLYKDLRASDKHALAIEAATRAGIISGDSHDGDGKTTVRANDNINRAEVAKILSRIMDLGL